jgi:hypothetical protein
VCHPPSIREAAKLMLWRALEWRAHLCQRDKPPMNICDQANTVVCRGSVRLCTVWVQCGLRRARCRLQCCRTLFVLWRFRERRARPVLVLVPPKHWR